MLLYQDVISRTSLQRFHLFDKARMASRAFQENCSESTEDEEIARILRWAATM